MAIFDLSNTTEQGFVMLAPGEYKARTKEWWLRKKEETGNLIIDIDLEITEGNYKGETPRYFHVITDQEFSKGYLLRMLKGVQIIEDGDRDEKGNLRVELVYGKTDDNGRVQIISVKVNDEEREVEGLSTKAVVKARNNKEGERVTGVDRLEVLDDAKNSQTNTTTKSTKANGKKPAAKKGSLPF